MRPGVAKSAQTDEKELGSSSDKIDLTLFRGTYPAQIESLIRRGRYEEGLELIPAVEEGMRRFGGAVTSVFGLYIGLTVAKLLFWAGRHREALRWLNPIVQTGMAEDASRYDLLGVARMLNLIIHYELGNQEYLPYAVRAVYRYLRKREILHGVENTLLKFILRLPDLNTRQEQTDFFRELRDALLPFRDDPYEKHAFEHFDYFLWLSEKSGAATAGVSASGHAP